MRVIVMRYSEDALVTVPDENINESEKLNTVLAVT